MLLVSFGRLHSHGPRVQRLDVLHFRGVGIGDGGRGDLIDALLQLVADTAADDEVWKVAAVEDIVWMRVRKLTWCRTGN